MPDDRATTAPEADAADELRRSLDRPTSSDELEELINTAIMRDIDAIMARVDVRLAAQRKEMDDLLARLNTRAA